MKRPTKFNRNYLYTLIILFLNLFFFDSNRIEQETCEIQRIIYSVEKRYLCFDEKLYRKGLKKILINNLSIKIRIFYIKGWEVQIMCVCGGKLLTLFIIDRDI